MHIAESLCYAQQMSLTPLPPHLQGVYLQISPSARWELAPEPPPCLLPTVAGQPVCCQNPTHLPFP